MSEPVTRNLVILLTDIKGFTDRTSHQSRAEMQGLLDRHKEIVLPVLQSKGGTLVKTMGDAFLMTYESSTNAVLAGIGVQAALSRYNEGKAAQERIDVRVAINQGEVNLADGDIFGEAVNITARIEAVADAGDVFFTEGVYLSMNKKEVPSSEVGLLQLKGIPEKIRVYRVKRENPVKSLGADSPAERAETGGRPQSPAAPPSRTGIYARIAAALVVAVGFLLARSRRHAAPALAPPHSLEVRVAGAKTFAQTVNVSEGKQGNFVGPMMTTDGRDSRQTVFNVVISPEGGKAGAFDVTYELDFAADPADPSSALKVQGDLVMKRGGVRAVECGLWTVDLALDGTGQEIGAAADGLDDYRVGAELSRGRDQQRCRQVLKLGAQGNVAEGVHAGDGSSFIFNAVPSPSANAGAVNLEFQLEYRPSASAELVQVQNQQTLELGRASRSQLSGYQFDLLAEGLPTPTAPAAK